MESASGRGPWPAKPITRPLLLHRAQRGDPVAVFSFRTVGFCLLPGPMILCYASTSPYLSEVQPSVGVCSHALLLAKNILRRCLTRPALICHFAENAWQRLHTMIHRGKGFWEVGWSLMVRLQCR
ncbi:hypothetical protein CCMA1212_003013 [Trichoderma ghanense]|uniref:Uncharacterized protein n=1 Tax=Trichoderma ghanense TaxID=65468 RepID=A0ABY2H8X4_9HYPO